MEKRSSREVFAANFKLYLKNNQKTQKDVVRDLHFGAGTVSEWSTGKKYPRADHIDKLAEYLGVERFQLTEDLNAYTTFQVNESSFEYNFQKSIKVNDDSLYPYFQVGDILNIKKQKEFKDGQFIALQYNRKLPIARQTNIKNKQITFVSTDSKKYPPISYNKKESTFEILGVVSSLYRKYE